MAWIVGLTIFGVLLFMVGMLVYRRHADEINAEITTGKAIVNKVQSAATTVKTDITNIKSAVTGTTSAPSKSQ
mgnify:CR=1 FL=1